MHESNKEKREKDKTEGKPVHHNTCHFLAKVCAPTLY